MRVGEMIESKYLKKEDTTRPVLLTIERFSKVNMAQRGKEDEVKWLMHFAETPKPLVMGPTKFQMCEQIFGSDETDEWVGRQVVLYEDPNVTDLHGKLVGGIRIRAPRVRTPDPVVQPRPRPAQDAPTHFEDLDDDIPF